MDIKVKESSDFKEFYQPKLELPTYKIPQEVFEWFKHHGCVANTIDNQYMTIAVWYEVVDDSKKTVKIHPFSAVPKELEWGHNYLIGKKEVSDDKKPKTIAESLTQKQFKTIYDLGETRGVAKTKDRYLIYGLIVGLIVGIVISQIIG